jgi:hypothetical protein
MGRFLNILKRTAQGLLKAISRFPLTVLALALATSYSCYMISLDSVPSLPIQKLMFTFLLGAFIGVVSQFGCERFDKWQEKRWAVYLVSVLLTIGYYFILMPVPSIDFAVITRTLVAIFAMFCGFIWLPSFRSEVDFNSIALTHFKSAFISVLYGAVLSLGFSSIIAATDKLLFRVNQDAYGYSMAIIWIFFTTLHYLSLLPFFNSQIEEDVEYARHSADYPKMLKTLISYIMIPLFAIYSLILLAYFVKIGITFKWPSGQLGPMILAYSAIGLIVYVLASRLEDKISGLYRRLFPKMLIIMVIMQLVSVILRLNAYGVTEARYYLTLFGVYSLICGIYLSFKPVSKNSIIALLGAGMAILSVLPPVDAFTVSRNSQISRLENMLQNQGILNNGKISPKAEVPLELRLETVSILNYLEQRKYLKYIAWLPADFKTESKMKSTFGFEPAYEGINPEALYFNASLSNEKPLIINDFDLLIKTNSYMEMKEDRRITDFQISGRNYKLFVQRLSGLEVKVWVEDYRGLELIGTGLYDFAKSLSGIGPAPKEALPPETMTLELENKGYRLKIVFENVSINYGSNNETRADYSYYLLFAEPKNQ